jgi:serine/threonine protein kinase
MQGLPHIVEVYGAWVERDNECIVMKLYPNGSLFDLLRSPAGEQMSWDERLRLSYEVVQAIKLLHSAPGIILHRDIKSLNFLVDDDGSLVVCDFGLPKMVNSTGETTVAKGKVGTVRWMAPEVFLYEDTLYTEKCDVFSLGVVLYEIATGLLPWENKHDHRVIDVVGDGKRMQIPASVPPQFQRWIEWSWDQDPDKRPTCAELLKEMSEYREMREIQRRSE